MEPGSKPSAIITRVCLETLHLNSLVRLQSLGQPLPRLRSPAPPTSMNFLHRLASRFFFLPAMRPPLISIIGATGTGKSQVINYSSPPPYTSIPGAQINSSHRQLAVELALCLNGEVINADAMQLYRDLPIITNKITPEERRAVPHHLLGCLDTAETWQVGRFVKEAESTVSFCSLWVYMKCSS